MKLAVYGSGYVGLVAALCFAKMGHQVICQDINAQKIQRLQAGEIPLFEPGLEVCLQEAIYNQCIDFTLDPQVAYAHGELHFIAVGTPSQQDGSADLQYVYEVAKGIAQQVNHSPIVVIKSTVPIGTGAAVTSLMQDIFEKRGVSYRAHLISNPEFLREGCAVPDFLQPDRVVIGGEDALAIETVRQCYATFVSADKILTMTRAAAEMTKYASNALLATKISFINELACLAEKTGVDIMSVKKGIALDHRIGPHFIEPGCGYGGSCFPKDIAALSHIGLQYGCDMPLLSAVSTINLQQKRWPVEKLLDYYQHTIAGKVIAIWGLSFKPDTDDMREATSITVIEALLAAGAQIQVYDPAAYSQAKKIWTDKEIMFADSPLEALEGANALLLLTEWACFRHIPLVQIKPFLSDLLLIDGRNVFDPIEARQLGIHYVGVGRIFSQRVKQSMEINKKYEAISHAD